jgi:phosphatidylglycerophosphate synthase
MKLVYSSKYFKILERIIVMEATSSKIFSVPNLLSFLRLILVPVLIWIALEGLANYFLMVLGVSLISDMLDGYLARKLDQVSELGAKLDSWADTLTYASMIFGLYQIWPTIFSHQALFLLSATLSFLVPLIASAIKFGQYPSYHTLGAKIAALLIAPAYYFLILVDADTWFRLVILFYLLVASEEVAITIILKKPETNIVSVWSLIRRFSNQTSSR